MSQKIYSDRTELEGVDLPSAGQTKLLVIGEDKKIKSEVKPVIPDQVNLIEGSNITITGTYPNLTISASGTVGINWEDIGGDQSTVNLSGFTNDAGFITEADLPPDVSTTIPDWEEKTYNQGDLVAYNNNIWRSEYDDNDQEPTDLQSSWEVIEPEFDYIFYGNDGFSPLNTKLYEGSVALDPGDEIPVALEIGDRVVYIMSTDGVNFSGYAFINNEEFPAGTPILTVITSVEIELLYMIQSDQTFCLINSITSDEDNIYQLISCPATPIDYVNKWKKLIEVELPNPAITRVDIGGGYSYFLDSMELPIVGHIPEENVLNLSYWTGSELSRFATAQYSGIFAGISNSISSHADNSVILGGKGNTISSPGGTNSAIIGGEGNVITNSGFNTYSSI